MGNLQLSTGSLFGNRFEIDKTAGSGGMGTVYRARDRYSGEIVALKLLHSGVGGPDEAERFTREAQLLSELRHPGIVSHIGHGQTPDGQRFLAMEWLEGLDLGQRLARGPLPLRDCLVLLEHIADALSVAHQRGIIHRDLKPTNLFLCNGDVSRVKILDFGIARRVATSQAMTRTGMVVGTPEYMAPEQARGSRDLLPATDMFSLGCVLYECLTGQPPFVADHVAAVLVRILFEEPAPIEEQRTGIPGSLITLLGRLLAKDVGQRLGDAAALRAEILALGELSEPSLAATMASPRPKAAHFADQEQSLFSIVLAAPAEEEIGLGATQAGSGVQLAATDRRALLQALTALGAAPDFLANGTLVVTVPSMASAQDQATLAAHAALLIKVRWPDAVVSMATGRGAVRGRTAVGEVVELAARSLKSGTPPTLGKPTTGVLIDPLSAKLLEGRFAQTPQSGGAMLLHEERDVDASRPLLGKPTPCVGREAELGTLESQFAACIEESEARVVLFSAPPGAGKSRLRHEFLRRVEKQRESLTVLAGRGDLMSAGAPYSILGQGIRKLCAISGGEPPEEQRRRMEARVGAHVADPEKQRVVLFVGELAGVPFPADCSVMLPPAREDPRIMRDRIRRAFLDWLGAECQAAPLLLILDDLQWGDILSVGLVDDALRELANSPLFVLAMARPEAREQFPGLWQGHKLQEIVLKGLSRKACERLVQQVLGKQVAPELMARLVDQSGGNALYLEELIRAAAEGNTGEQSATVVAMLQARIGRLQTGPRRAVLAASIFGHAFWAGGVTAVLGMDPDSHEAAHWLEDLQKAEMIQPTTSSRFVSASEYSFRHALVREAAAGLLTEQDLRTGHLRAGEFLDTAGESDRALIAEHFERGGDNPRAVTNYVRAADSALNRHALELSLRHIKSGVACGASGEELGLLRALESYASHQLGRLQHVLQCAMSALALLRPGSRARGRALHSACIGALLGSPEGRAQLPALAAELIQTDPEPGAEPAYTEGLLYLGGVMSVAAPAAQCQPILSRLNLLTARAADRDPMLRRHYLGAKCHIAFHSEPRPWTILKEAEEVFRLYREVEDLRNSMIFFAIDLVWSWRALGDDDRALSLLEANRALAKSAAGTPPGHLFTADIGAILASRSDAASHNQAVEHAEEVLRGGPFPITNPLAYDTLARVYLQRGDFAAAETAARQALQSMFAVPNFFPNVRAPLIRALLAQGRAAEAREIAEAGLAFMQQFRHIGHAEVELRLAISEAFHAAGDREHACAELDETLRQIQRRADDITDPFWKNSYLTRNPHCARAEKLRHEWGLDIVAT